MLASSWWQVNIAMYRKICQGRCNRVCLRCQVVDYYLFCALAGLCESEGARPEYQQCHAMGVFLYMLPHGAQHARHECRKIVKELVSRELKAQFCNDALATADKFTKATTLEQDLLDAVEWISGRTPERVNEERECIMRQIEAAAFEMREHGQCTGWLKCADGLTKQVAGVLFFCHRPLLCVLGGVQVSKEVNGPLMEMLADTCRHHDKEAAQLFRKGGPLVSPFDCFVFAQLPILRVRAASGRQVEVHRQWEAMRPAC